MDISLGPSLTREGKTLEQAADFLGCDTRFLLADIIQSHIPCGVLGTMTWKGVCLPELPDYVEWSSERLRPDKTSPRLLWYQYTATNEQGEIVKNLTLREMIAGDFWYLARGSTEAAPDVAESHPKPSAVRYLEPWNGDELHKANPESFPPMPFLCYLHTPVQISTADLIFLRSDLALIADQRTENRWPWGEHETELLRHLAAAAQEWWSTYDPDNPSTAPISKDVVQWLRGKGLGKTIAESMAQILRADGLPSGPRK